MKTIKHDLRAWRELRELTREKLAAMLGVHPQTIYRREQAGVVPVTWLMALDIPLAGEHKNVSNEVDHENIPKTNP